jgi:hypothetical protein
LCGGDISNFKILQKVSLRSFFFIFESSIWVLSSWVLRINLCWHHGEETKWRLLILSWVSCLHCLRHVTWHLHELLRHGSRGSSAWLSSLLSHHLLLHCHLLSKHGLVLLEHLLMEGHLLVDQLLLIHEHLVLTNRCIRRLAISDGKGIHERSSRLSGLGSIGLSFSSLNLCLFCSLSCGNCLFLSFFSIFFFLFGCCCSCLFTLQFLLCSSCCLSLLLGLIFFSLETFFLLPLDLLRGSLSKQLGVLILAVFTSDVFLLFGIVFISILCCCEIFSCLRLLVW